ncbi:MAG: hypothetical protein Ct9H300mP1_04170 [Planctomycetaceae bacterium]|nr:MAG: hypothetical protein Ct9H300mP1_04170 [Planctomycetaceae bacterium]
MGPLDWLLTGECLTGSVPSIVRQRSRPGNVVAVRPTEAARTRLCGSVVARFPLIPRPRSSVSLVVRGADPFQEREVMCGIGGLLIRRAEMRASLGQLAVPMLDCMGDADPIRRVGRL